ncbi:hypothetical protein M0R45_025312 [Rubus argutus]|uniref:Uncharacterized protein n=1 Tax=Rubus argutus TaxID=59490 RepID=A0AAW1WWR3_RUBAR
MPVLFLCTLDPPGPLSLPCASALLTRAPLQHRLRSIKAAKNVQAPETRSLKMKKKEKAIPKEPKTVAAPSLIKSDPPPSPPSSPLLVTANQP